MSNRGGIALLQPKATQMSVCGLQWPDIVEKIDESVGLRQLLVLTEVKGTVCGRWGNVVESELGPRESRVNDGGRWRRMPDRKTGAVYREDELGLKRVSR